MAKVGDLLTTANAHSEAIEQVYRRRAARLAERQDVAAQRATTPVLVCSLQNERYGIALTELTEVLPYHGCTNVPGAAPALIGVINVRGQIRPCADLRGVLGLAPADDDASGYVVMLRHDDGPVGLKVDKVDEVVQMDPIALRGLADGGRSRFVKAITPDAVILLDTGAILSALGLSAS